MEAPIKKKDEGHLSKERKYGFDKFIITDLKYVQNFTGDIRHFWGSQFFPWLESHRCLSMHHCVYQLGSCQYLPFEEMVFSVHITFKPQSLS